MTIEILEEAAGLRLFDRLGQDGRLRSFGACDSSASWRSTQKDSKLLGLPIETISQRSAAGGGAPATEKHASAK